MSKKNSKNDTCQSAYPLREEELLSPGVGKLLVDENNRLRVEIDALKKSLKRVQNKYENLRSKNHALDKENSILNSRLATLFLPEFLKFFTSSFIAAYAINSFFNGQIKIGVILFTIAVTIYGGILLLYRKKKNEV